MTDTSITSGTRMPTATRRMRSERRVAITVGALYIATTVAGLLAAATLGSLLDGPEALAGLAEHKTRVMASSFFQLVMAVGGAGIAFMFSPVLSRDADTPSKLGLARWFVGTRITESALLLVGTLCLLSLFELSQQIGAEGAARYQPAFDVLKTASDYAGVLAQSVFCVGAVMLYYLLYVSGRVPRWLSVWGLISVPMFLAAGFALAVTGEANSTFSNLMYAPLFVQEMVLAVWLLIRGFNADGHPGA
jgi:uncharacterized protein DUF4386